MSLDVVGVLKNAWAMARRDHAPLLGVAGLLMFVPQLTVLMMVQPQPPFPGFEADEAKLKAYVEASQAWTTSSGLGMLLAALAVTIGTVTILLLYLDSRQPDVKGGLLDALRRLPRFLLAFLLVSLPLGASLQLVPLLILPALYLEGRLLLVAPALAADRSLSVMAALRRSWTLTRGNGLVLAGVACIVYFAGPILGLPFTGLGRTLDGAPMANPVVAALLDAFAAAGLTAGALAGVLIQVVLYRRLVSSRGI